MKLPDFIIAGFGRCGTSGLYLNLGQHPDIYTPINPGTEMGFWARERDYLDTNMESYKSKFKGKVSGEKSPSYCKQGNIMKMISEYIPDIKIIICLRNPVYRANSFLELQKRWRRINQDVKLDMDLHTGVIKEGNYILAIKNCVLPYIPIENISFCIMERAKNDYIDSISKIQKFLGVEPYIVDVENHIITNKINNEKPYLKFFEDNSNYHIWSQSYYEETSEDQVEKLYNHYEKSNEELFDFLGYDIPEWKTQEK